MPRSRPDHGHFSFLGSCHLSRLFLVVLPGKHAGYLAGCLVSSNRDSSSNCCYGGDGGSNNHFVVRFSPPFLLVVLHTF